MKTIIVSSNCSKAMDSLRTILYEYCVHTFTNGSANLVNPEIKDKRNIIRELGAVSRMALDIKDGSAIRIPQSFIPQILNFIGRANMYNPEAVLILTNSYLMCANE